METQTHVIGHDIEQLANDASALLAATADVAGDKIVDARKRIAGALERGKDIFGVLRDRATVRTYAVDHAVHENLYLTIAAGIGIGVLAGYILSKKCNCHRG